MFSRAQMDFRIWGWECHIRDLVSSSGYHTGSACPTARGVNVDHLAKVGSHVCQTSLL